MRKLGVAFIGLISGLLVGLLFADVIARVAMSGSEQLPDSLPLALLLGFLSPLWPLSVLCWPSSSTAGCSAVD